MKNCKHYDKNCNVFEGKVPYRCNFCKDLRKCYYADNYEPKETPKEEDVEEIREHNEDIKAKWKQEPKEEKHLSDCCKAPVTVEGGLPDFIGDKENKICTMSFACSKCGKPCSIHEEDDIADVGKMVEKYGEDRLKEIWGIK